VTTVRIALLAPTADGVGKRPTGNLAFKPTKRRTVGDDVVLPAPFNVGITDPPSTAEVAPTEPGWAWEVVERVSGGSPHKRLLAVPDSPTVVDYADLVELDPATLDPAAEPEAAWWAAIEALLPSGGTPGQVLGIDDDGHIAWINAAVGGPTTALVGTGTVDYSLVG
jgi:hypothetical protein